MLLDAAQPVRARLETLVGLILATATVVLGLYPSFLTPASAVVAPSVLGFVVAFAAPSVLCKLPWLRWYLIVAASVALASISFEVIYLIIRGAKVTRNA